MRYKILALTFALLLVVVALPSYIGENEVSGTEISATQMLKELRIIAKREGNNFTTQYVTKEGKFTLMQKNGVRELIVHSRVGKESASNSTIILYSYPQRKFATGLALGRTIICRVNPKKEECIDITLSYLDPMGSFTKEPLPKNYFGYSRREVMQLSNQYLPTKQRLDNIIIAYEKLLQKGSSYNYLKVEGDLRCIGWARNKDDFIDNRLVYYGCFNQAGYQSGSMGTGEIKQSQRSYYSKLTPFPAKVTLLARSHPFSPFALKFLGTVEGIESEYILSLNQEPILP